MTYAARNLNNRLSGNHDEDIRNSYKDTDRKTKANHEHVRMPMKTAEDYKRYTQRTKYAKDFTDGMSRNADKDRTAKQHGDYSTNYANRYLDKSRRELDEVKKREQKATHESYYGF